MGKADIKLSLDAETQKFIGNLRSTKDALNESATGARRLGHEVEEAGHSAEGAGRGFSGLSDSISGTAAGMLSLGSVAGTVMKAYNSELEDAKKKADELRKSIESLEDVLAKQGRLAELPQIREKLDKMAEGKITREEMRGIDLNVRAALGDRADEATIEAADKAGVVAMAGGRNATSAAEFAKAYGQVSLINQHAGTKMSEADTAETAQALQAALGPEGLSDKMERAIYRSKVPTKAMDLVITAAHSREGAKVLDTIAAAADEDIDQKTEEAKLRKLDEEKRNVGANNFTRQPEVDEVNRRLALIKAAPNKDDRFAAMIAHPELAAAPHRRVLENLEKEQKAYIEDAIANQTFAGLVKTDTHLRLTDPQTHATFLRHQADVDADKQEHHGEVPATTDEAVWTHNQTQMRKEGSGPYEAASFNWIDRALHYVGADKVEHLIGHQTPYEKGKAELQRRALDELKKNNEGFGQGSSAGFGPGASAADPHAELLGGILEEMRRNNDLTEKHLNVAMRPPKTPYETALRNNSAGQA